MSTLMITIEPITVAHDLADEKINTNAVMMSLHVTR